MAGVVRLRPSGGGSMRSGQGVAIQAERLSRRPAQRCHQWIQPTQRLSAAGLRLAAGKSGLAHEPGGEAGLSIGDGHGQPVRRRKLVHCALHRALVPPPVLAHCRRGAGRGGVWARPTPAALASGRKSRCGGGRAAAAHGKPPPVCRCRWRLLPAPLLRPPLTRPVLGAAGVVLGEGAHVCGRQVVVPCKNAATPQLGPIRSQVFCRPAVVVAGICRQGKQRQERRGYR